MNETLPNSLPVDRAGDVPLEGDEPLSAIEPAAGEAAAPTEDQDGSPAEPGLAAADDPVKKSAPLVPFLEGPCFSIQRQADSDRMVIVLDGSFSIADWPALETHYREQIAAGCIEWSLDLRQMALLTSRLIGLMIGLNTILSMRGGDLKIIVGMGSFTGRSLVQARLHQVLTIVEL